MRIGVGVCNFNRAGLLVETIQSILDQQVDLRRLVVVDNASTDDSLARLRGITDPRLRVVALTENRGGAGGFQRASAALLEEDLDAVALVDSDCVLVPGCLETLAGALLEGAHIAGPRVLHAERPSLVQEAGGALDWTRARAIRRQGGLDERRDRIPSDSADVDYVAACALLASREVFDIAGHFRPEFFVYFDDIDWCVRAARRGFRIVCRPQARALHHGGGRHKTSLFPSYYFWRNRIRFFLEHSRDAGAARHVLLCDAAQAVATCRCWSQDHAAAVVLQAARDGLAGRSGRLELNGTGSRFALDPVPNELDPVAPGSRPVLVSHIFESALPDADGDPLIRDAFGKTARRGRIEALRSRYQLEKRRLCAELQDAGG